MLRLSGGLAKGIADAKVIVPSDENLELSEVFPCLLYTSDAADDC